MQVDKSFEKYIEKTYYNEIFNKVKGYVFYNKDHLDVATSTVPDPKKVELEDFSIVSAIFSDAPGYQIQFDLVIEAEINVEGKGRYDWEDDSVGLWFLLPCTGILKDGLNTVRFGNVSVYSKKRFEETKRLTRTLIPYISSKRLDEVAEDFLREYYPLALLQPMALPVEEVAAKMGLNIVEASISKTMTTFGQVYFSDSEISVYDRKNDAYTPMNVVAGTIVVDPEVFFMRSIGSKNNTIIHECVHWDKHKRYFELRKLFDNSLQSISCRVVEGTPADEKKRSDVHWMEWQANALAPRILMPATMTKKKIEELLLQYHVEFGRASEAFIMEMVIMQLSEIFQVTLFAAKMRAIDLGYEQAIGVFPFIDNKYLPSYSFKQGVLQKNQTFVIGLQDVVYEYATNMAFKQKMQSGDFVYIDGLVCINNPKYIEDDETGKQRLTSYARGNVHECCLIFDIVSKTNNRYGLNYYKECYLCKDIISDVFTETKFVDTQDSQDKQERAAELRKLTDETAKIVRIQRETPVLFCDALKYHMKRVGCTVEGLAQDSLIGYKTIQNMRNDENYSYSLTNVLPLCLGMHLHPEFSKVMLEKAGLHLLPTKEEHVVYDFLLNHYYKASIHECNEVLKEYGITPFGTEVKEI